MLPERVAGVVLAAGLSSRMGVNKMLLELGGRTLVRRSVTTAFSAGLDPVLVVLGHESDRVRAELSGLPYTAVLNSDYARGMNTSLRAGIAALLTMPLGPWCCWATCRWSTHRWCGRC